MYTTTQAPVPTPAPSDGPSKGELLSFYAYRAQSAAYYQPLNINAANLPGVMWYLQHEVVTEVPPKFGIVRILRFKVQTKAPQRLLDKGMNFGVRYAYDSQQCTGPGQCWDMYEKYGYFVGCNKFESAYPYPINETYYDGGLWYSFDGHGACPGPPNGGDHCTFAYNWPPAEITLEELQGADGQGFWDAPEDRKANAAKVARLRELFNKKFPDSEDLPDPVCDFNFGDFWS